jgi:dinuclear metal center YbgI/SA1388 family protein
MKLKEVISYFESIAPLNSQESYDNSGLLIGESETEIRAILVCLDCTEEVVEEAQKLGCNLIVSHHPLIFKGLKSLTGKNYVERTVLKCIRNNISLYSIHTNLDNSIKGVNAEIGKRLGLSNLSILDPKQNVLFKLEVFVPETNVENLSNALYAIGVGKIGNYSDCGFFSSGTGTFRPIENANPTVGKLNELSREREVKAEFLVSSHLLDAAIITMKLNHIYEEVAHNVIPLLNSNQTEGSGMIGVLPTPQDEVTFLSHLKNTFHTGSIRHSPLLGKEIRKVAFCGGAGSFLLQNAIAMKADVFITADFKYHEFFDADRNILIVDIGHYESEQFTSELLVDLLKKKFTNFAVHLTGVNTNPINYF